MRWKNWPWRKRLHYRLLIVRQLLILTLSCLSVIVSTQSISGYVPTLWRCLCSFGLMNTFVSGHYPKLKVVFDSVQGGNISDHNRTSTSLCGPSKIHPSRSGAALKTLSDSPQQQFFFPAFTGRTFFRSCFIGNDLRLWNFVFGGFFSRENMGGVTTTCHSLQTAEKPLQDDHTGCALSFEFPPPPNSFLLFERVWLNLTISHCISIWGTHRLFCQEAADNTPIFHWDTDLPPLHTV